MEKITSLYKFTSFDPSGYSLSNLRNSSIYYSHPEDFNDPFDSKVHANSSFSQDEYRRFLQKIGSNSHYANSSKKLSREGFHPIKNNLKNYIKEEVNKHFDVGISCFSEGWQSILMWGHYACNHTGFCLEYDVNHRPFSSAVSVIYTKSRPSPKALDLMVDLIKMQDMEQICIEVNDETFETIKNLLNEHDICNTTVELHSFAQNSSPRHNSSGDDFSILFFAGKLGKVFNDVIRKKHSDWNYEKEWRVFSKSYRLTVEVPRKSLKSITLGLKSTNEDIISLCAACEGYGDIPIYRCHEIDNKYGIVRKLINKKLYR